MRSLIRGTPAAHSGQSAWYLRRLKIIKLGFKLSVGYDQGRLWLTFGRTVNRPYGPNVRPEISRTPKVVSGDCHELRQDLDKTFAE